LLERYHREGDESARERVIQEQLPLAGAFIAFAVITL
jgi:hypothetical protein